MDIHELRNRYEELRGMAEKAVAAIDALASESTGVIGLHRNGDVANWDSLFQGGQFEDWLMDVDGLRVRLTETNKEVPAWENDMTQFARLLCEINATLDVKPEDWKALRASMDLELDQLNELFDRANKVWEEAKKRLR